MQARDGVFLEDLCPKLRARQWRRTLHALTDHRCLYCGSPSESIDHVFPRSRGGLSSDENCVPACLQCNGDKGDSEAFLWYRSQRFYDPRRAMALRAWVEGDRALAQRLLSWAVPQPARPEVGVIGTAPPTGRPAPLEERQWMANGPLAEGQLAGGQRRSTGGDSAGRNLRSGRREPGAASGRGRTGSGAVEARAKSVDRVRSVERVRSAGPAQSPDTARPAARAQLADGIRLAETLQPGDGGGPASRGKPAVRGKAAPSGRSGRRDVERGGRRPGANVAARSQPGFAAERSGSLSPAPPQPTGSERPLHQTRQAATPLWRWQMAS